MPPGPRQSHAASQPRDQLEEADRLRQQGKLDRAESICYALIRRYPDYMAALHTLGLVYLDKRNFDRALDCLVRAVMFDPKNWMTLTALSLAYLRLGASDMAAQTLERALAVKPMDASIFASLGEIHREEREYELAQHDYRKALSLDRDLETAEVGLALCLSALGQYSEAAGVVAESYRRGHRSINLFHVMTALPRNMVSIDVVAAVDALAAGSIEPDGDLKNTFAFVRAAALDMAGRHAEAWQCLAAANRPLAAASQPELKANVIRQAKSMAWLRGASIRPIELGNSGVVPVSLFILGPSQSGKTSLERLVGALEGVKSGYENPIVENAVRVAFQSAAIPPSTNLEELPPQLLPSFREHYLQDLARRAGAARVFTNTLPGRIYDAGLIATAIPKARFLLVKRSLEDNALRIYMKKYLRANPYAYGMQSILDYLNWYNEMIDLTAEKLPQIARIVSYEAMTVDPAAVLREAADLCGIAVKDSPVPALENDVGCARPYREFMVKD